MEAEELKNYLCRRVIITLKDSQKFKGYFKRIDSENIVLNNLQYHKDIILPIKDIIGIKVLINFFERQRRIMYNKE